MNKRHCWLRLRRHKLVFAHRTSAYIWRRCEDCGWLVSELITDRLLTPKKYDRVRIVEMRGCMATDRANVRSGVVIGFVSRKVYGDWQSRSYAIIRFDDGTTAEYVVRSGLWILFEGQLEYHE